MTQRCTSQGRVVIDTADLLGIDLFSHLVTNLHIIIHVDTEHTVYLSLERAKSPADPPQRLGYHLHQQR